MRYFELVSKEYGSISFDFKSNDDDGFKDSFRDYLIQNAIIDQEKGIGTTHLFIDENDSTGEKKILGFYTLRCSSLIISSEGNNKIGEPALEIYELAVHKDYERTGIGSILMKNIFANAINLNKTLIGIKHVVLCSIEDAVKFYEDKFGFKPIASYEQVPREFSNLDCLSMSVRLPKAN
jgi:ribosomal protein S18 acetylase RimI-like enzyme